MIDFFLLIWMWGKWCFQWGNWNSLVLQRCSGLCADSGMIAPKQTLSFEYDEGRDHIQFGQLAKEEETIVRPIRYEGGSQSIMLFPSSICSGCCCKICMTATFAILCWLLRVKRTSGKVKHHTPTGSALDLMVRALSNNLCTTIVGLLNLTYL